MSGANGQPSRKEGAPNALRVVLLTAADGGLGTAGHLIQHPELEIVATASLPDLVRAAQGTSADAVVLDPELGDSWPVDTAEAVVGAPQRSLPVMLLCRSQVDAEQIKHRLGPLPGTLLLLASEHDGKALVAALRGLVALARA